jgi:hypothetical protein
MCRPPLALLALGLAVSAAPLRTLRLDPQGTRIGSGKASNAKGERSGTFLPGDKAPPLVFDTLGGSVNLQSILPAVVNVLDPDSLFSSALWSLNVSIDGLLKTTPRPTTHFVFASNRSDEGAATRDVRALEKLIVARMNDLGMDDEDSASRFHFVTSPLSSLGWLPSLLESWPTTRDEMTAYAPDGTVLLRTPVLNSHFEWLGWHAHPTTLKGRHLSLRDFGHACDDRALEQALAAHHGKEGEDWIALVDAAGQCAVDYEAKVFRAARAGASAVVFVADSSAAQPTPLAPPAPRESLDFATLVTDKGHSTRPEIPAVLLEAQAALTLRRSFEGQDLLAAIETVQVCGTDVAVDQNGLLQQSWGGSGLGNVNDTTYGNPGDPATKQHPDMSFLVWAGQHLDFRYALDSVLEHEESVQENGMVVVPVFNNTPIQNQAGHCYGNYSTMYNCGPNSTVTLPDNWSQFQRLTLDFALGCGGPMDIDCPQWDHVVTAQVCAISAGASTCDAQNDGIEFGRWITTFSRRIGRWATDISALAPLLALGGSGSAVNMTIMTVPWAGSQGAIPWTATLNLRFSHPASSGDLVPIGISVPWYDAAEPVWSRNGNGVYTYFRWVPFNQSYESYFPPTGVTTPPEAKQARLLAVISGHGNDNNGCGEFCSTLHKFDINGDSDRGMEVEVVHFDVFQGEPSGRRGCADGVEFGTSPNEYGTWCVSHVLSFSFLLVACVARAAPPEPRTLACTVRMFSGRRCATLASIHRHGRSVHCQQVQRYVCQQGVLEGRWVPETQGREGELGEGPLAAFGNGRMCTDSLSS